MAVSPNEKSSNQSVSRLMFLLDCLSGSRMPLRLQEIAERTQMSQATALRYLNALAIEGYVYQDNISERYALTRKICRIGEQVSSNMSLRTLSGDIVNELANSLDVGISLVIEHEMECMYLDCIYEPLAMGPTLVRIGRQAPLHSTSSGKLFLTGYSEAELKRFLETKGLPALTERTITTEAALRAELDRIRENGYATDNEECEPGLCCVAVPLYGYQEQPVAAMSAFGSSDRVTAQSVQETILPLLKKAAGKISFRLGCPKYENLLCHSSAHS